MELETGLTVARATTQSILTTLRDNGRPQLSNVLHTVDPAGVIRISTTADRAKYVNLVRRPWAALHVNGADFFAYAVLEGDVSFSAVVGGPGDPAADELVDLYRDLMGEHEDWADYRRALVTDRRVVIRITPTRAYGIVRLPA